jgi:hypothetical protein
MRRIGIKTLNWDNIKRLKQDLLYFDQVCFDSSTFKDYMQVQRIVLRVGAVFGKVYENNLWDRNLSFDENMDKGYKLLEQEPEGFDAAVEKILIKNGSLKDYEALEADIQFLLDNKYISPINTPQLLLGNIKADEKSLTIKFPFKEFDPPLDNNSLEEFKTLFIEEVKYLEMTANGDIPFAIKDESTNTTTLNTDWISN